MTHKLVRALLPVSFVCVLASCRRSAEDYLSRGNRFFASEKYADAQLNYSRAIQKNPQLGEAYYRLGLAEEKQNHSIPAYQALRKAVELLPNDADAKAAMADLCFALYFESPTKPKLMYDQAAQLAAQILQLNPNSPDGFRLKGALSLVDQKPVESAEFYRKANELRPMNGEIVVGYAQALFRSGQTAKAEALALTFLSNVPNYDAVYETLFNSYMSLNRLADAERIVKQWIAKNPKNSSAVLRLAAYYSRLQKSAEVSSVLQRLTNDPTDFPHAYMLAGDFYAGLKSWPEAVAQYERGAQTDSGNAVSYRKKLVTALLAQGKQQEAVNLLDSMVNEAPKDSELRAVRSRVWLETGKSEAVDAALAEFQAQVKERSNDAALHYDLGRAYLLKSNTSAARTHLLKAAQLSRDFLPPRFDLAQLALNQQNPADGLRYAEDALQISPGDPKGRLLRASGLMGTNRLPEARNELRSLLRDYPRYRDAQIQMGFLAINEKNFKDAEDIFRRLGETKGDDVRPSVGLAGAYASQKQYDKAIQILSEEARKSPNNLAVENVLALTAIEAKRYSLAIENFQRIATAKPTSLGALVNLAGAYRLNGDSAKAVEVLQNAKRLDSSDPAASAALAKAFFNNGRLDEFQDVLRRVVRLQPDNAAALNNLAFLIAEVGGDLNEAKELVERALRKNANDSSAQDTLGWIYLKKNMTDDALQIFTRLIKTNPDEPSFRYHLGAALLKKGEKEKARNELRAALDKKPQLAERDTILGLLAGMK
jgi:tetratricopeptide (TPR) repeat protein